MLLSVNDRNFSPLVLQSSTPVLAHFWAPWCGVCKMIIPQLSQFETECRGHIKLVSINADESLKLASTYKLKTLPTLMLFVNGQVVDRVDHFQGRDDLRKTLISFAQRCQLSQLLELEVTSSRSSSGSIGLMEQSHKF